MKQFFAVKSLSCATPDESPGRTDLKRVAVITVNPSTDGLTVATNLSLRPYEGSANPRLPYCFSTTNRLVVPCSLSSTATVMVLPDGATVM